MGYERTLLALIGHVYAAAEEPAKWGEFVRAYAAGVSADTSALFMQHLNTPDATFAALHNLERAREFETYYSSVNPLMLLNQQRMVEGDAYPSQRTIADADFERTEFYADFLQPQNLHHELGCVLLKRDGVSAHLSALRARNRGAFTDEEVTLLRMLMPHVQCALRLHRTFIQLNSRAESLFAAIEEFGPAIFILDSNGQICEVNRAGRHLLAVGDTLTGAARHLHAVDPRSDFALRAAVGAARKAFAETTVPGRESVPIARLGGGEPLEAFVAPVHRGGALGHDSAVVVMVEDRSHAQSEKLSHFQKMYRLTPAEFKLLKRLAAGSTLKESAFENGITLNTAREYLKRIFAKTGARRQIDLARLLSR